MRRAIAFENIDKRCTAPPPPVNTRMSIKYSDAISSKQKVRFRNVPFNRRTVESYEGEHQSTH
jgi:hypothetical protein